MKPLSIRSALPTDYPFIFSTYLRNRWFSKENTTTLQKNTWMRLQHTRLERILAEQPVLIACLSADPDTILGYRFKDGSDDWTYVKLAWRAEGVKTALEKEPLQ